MHIQLEGCVDELGEYSITASRTLSEAFEAFLDPATSQETLKQINAGSKVDLSLPLQILNQDGNGK